MECRLFLPKIVPCRAVSKRNIESPGEVSFAAGCREPLVNNWSVRMANEEIRVATDLTRDRMRVPWVEENAAEICLLSGR